MLPQYSKAIMEEYLHENFPVVNSSKLRIENLLSRKYLIVFLVGDMDNVTSYCPEKQRYYPDIPQSMRIMS